MAMKIGGVQGTSSVYNASNVTSKYKAGGNQSAGAKKDSVSISNSAKDVQIVTNALKNIPDVREDIVKEISEKYNSNNYDVEASDIVEKVANALKDNKI